MVHEPGSGNGAKMRWENKDDASEMGHRLLEIVVVHGKSVAISLKSRRHYSNDVMQCLSCSEREVL